MERHGLMSMCVNNHGFPGSLTGAYGMAHDVDDDTGYADIGHPGYALLSTHIATNSPPLCLWRGFQMVTNCK